MLVTGASDGIGFHTALQLALDGARVLVHARNEAKATDAVRRLVDEGATAPQLVPVWGDLADLAQVRSLAAQVRQAAPTLSVLVNNAGVFMNTYERTADGFEVAVGVIHLAPGLLSHVLVPVREASFEGYAAYAASKLMNVLFTHALARHLEGRRVAAFALHPGVISTKLLQTGFGMGGAEVATGARTSVFCATAPGLEVKTGAYFSDAREVPCAPHANDPALEQALYAKSCQLVGCAPLT